MDSALAFLLRKGTLDGELRLAQTPEGGDAFVCLLDGGRVVFAHDPKTERKVVYEEAEMLLGLAEPYRGYDGAPGVGFFDEELEPPAKGEGSRPRPLVSRPLARVSGAIDAPEVWEVLREAHEGFARHLARALQEEAKEELLFLERRLEELRKEEESLHKALDGQLLPSRAWPLYLKALEAEGVVSVGHQAEGRGLSIRGERVTFHIEESRASPEVVGLLLHLEARIPPRLLGERAYDPHAFGGRVFADVGSLSWRGLGRGEPAPVLFPMEPVGGHGGRFFPLAQESPHVPSRWEALPHKWEELPRYVLVPFRGKEGNTFVKALVLPKGGFDLLDPRAQVADPRRYPEVVEAGRAFVDTSLLQDLVRREGEKERMRRLLQILPEVAFGRRGLEPDL